MIITRLSGGMGNQMFQYALGRALSLKYGVPLLLDVEMQKYLYKTNLPTQGVVFRDYKLELFSISAQIATKDNLPWWGFPFGHGKIKVIIDAIRRQVLPHPGKEKKFNFDPAILSCGPNVYLDGYWQSQKYFIAYADTIRKEFQIKELPTKHISDLGKEMSSCQSVCVHVRRGDYVGNSFYEQLNKEYYVSGMAHIKEKVAVDHVYIFSDDTAWCKDNLVFDFEVTYVGDEYKGDHDEGHFWLMQQCRNFINANSTFSWWAAWLAPWQEKIVIAPKKWFADTAIDTSDLIPDTWLRL